MKLTINLNTALPKNILGRPVLCEFNYIYISEDGTITVNKRENCLVFCQVEILEEGLNVRSSEKI